MRPPLRPRTSTSLRRDHCHRQVSFLQKVEGMAKYVCEDCTCDPDALRCSYFEGEQDGDTNFEIDDDSTMYEESQDGVSDEESGAESDEESGEESDEEVWELQTGLEEAPP
jgi:hypothetical protein